MTETDKTREAIEVEAETYADSWTHREERDWGAIKDGYLVGYAQGIAFERKRLAGMAGQDILKKMLTSFHRFAPTGYSGLLEDPISQWSRHCEKLIRETYERTAAQYEAKIELQNITIKHLQKNLDLMIASEKERDELKAKLAECEKYPPKE